MQSHAPARIEYRAAPKKPKTVILRRRDERRLSLRTIRNGVPNSPLQRVGFLPRGIALAGDFFRFAEPGAWVRAPTAWVRIAVRLSTEAP